MLVNVIQNVKYSQTIVIQFFLIILKISFKNEILKKYIIIKLLDLLEILALHAQHLI